MSLLYCPICHNAYKDLLTHCKSHNLTPAEFKSKYPHIEYRTKELELKRTNQRNLVRVNLGAYSHNNSLKLINAYNKKPKLCMQCNKKIEYEIRAAKFCNSSCSATYTNKRRVVSDEQKQNTSNTYYAKLDRKILFKQIIKKLDKSRCKCCNLFQCKTIDKCKFILSSKKILIDYFKLDKNNLIIGYDALITEINDLYYIQLKSTVELKEIYKIPGSTLRIFLKRIGFKLRDRKDSLINSYLTGRSELTTCTRYKHGNHTTWDNKVIFYRSSYELDYCKFLDSNKIKYEVEFLRIKYFDTNANKSRTAIPDFYLPDTNTIIEIKSAYTLNLQNMIDRVKAYKNLGYNFKLIVDFKEMVI